MKKIILVATLGAFLFPAPPASANFLRWFKNKFFPQSAPSTKTFTRANAFRGAVLKELENVPIRPFQTDSMFNSLQRTYGNMKWGISRRAQDPLNSIRETSLPSYFRPIAQPQKGSEAYQKLGKAYKNVDLSKDAAKKALIEKIEKMDNHTLQLNISRNTGLQERISADPALGDPTKLKGQLIATVNGRVDSVLDRTIDHIIKTETFDGKFRMRAEAEYHLAGVINEINRRFVSSAEGKTWYLDKWKKEFELRVQLAHLTAQRKIQLQTALSLEEKQWLFREADMTVQLKTLSMRKAYQNLLLQLMDQ